MKAKSVAVNPEAPADAQATRAPAGAWLPVAVVVAAWSAAAAVSLVAGVWPALGGAAVVLGALVVARDGTSLRPLMAWRPGAIGAGVLLGLLMTAATHALYPLVAHAVPFLARDTTLLYVKAGSWWHLSRSLLLVPVVVGEELVWRGLVQGTLARRLGASTALIAAAGIYALAQAPTGSPVLVLAALLCGLGWGALRALTGSLLAAIAAHLIWSELLLFVVPIVRGG